MSRLKNARNADIYGWIAVISLKWSAALCLELATTVNISTAAQKWMTLSFHWKRDYSYAFDSSVIQVAICRANKNLIINIFIHCYSGLFIRRGTGLKKAAISWKRNEDKYILQTLTINDWELYSLLKTFRMEHTKSFNQSPYRIGSRDYCRLWRYSWRCGDHALTSHSDRSSHRWKGGMYIGVSRKRRLWQEQDFHSCSRWYRHHRMQRKRYNRFRSSGGADAAAYRRNTLSARSGRGFSFMICSENDYLLLFQGAERRSMV